MTDRDYYEILGLTPRADGMMVDQAYWHLARKYQALAITNPGARAMLDELNEAYGVLGTPRLREQYDAFRDDVLLQKGMLQPVASKPKRARPQQPGDEAATPRRTAKRKAAEAGAAAEKPTRAAPRFAFPALALPKLGAPPLRHDLWHWYAGAAVTTAILGATIWLSLGPLLVVAVGCAAIALAATRTLQRSLPAVALTLPQAAEELRAPARRPRATTTAPRPRGRQAVAVDDEQAAELRSSTAAMIARWRNSVGLKAPEPSVGAGEARQPSTTLMDIVSSERAVQAPVADGEPLAAVIDILRGPARPVELK